MSGQVERGERGLLWKVAVGSGAALACYAALQLLLAGLVSWELLSLGGVAKAEGLAAAGAVFLGGALAGRGQGGGRAPVAGGVLVGFLLTVILVALAAGGRPLLSEAGGPVMVGAAAAAVGASVLRGTEKQMGERENKRKTAAVT